MAESSVSIEATAQGFKELYQQSKDFDRKLATNLRKRVRDAAKSVVGRTADNIRSVAQNANQQGGTRAHPYSPGELTSAMANALTVLVNTGNDPKVTIRERSSQLPTGKQMLARKWERKRAWRHPVFADATKQDGEGGTSKGSWRGAWTEGIRPQPVYPQLIKSRPWFTWNMAEAMRETAQAMASAVNSNPN